MSKTWTMQNGTTIPIKDMDDRHLINTIRMLERSAEARYMRDLDVLMMADPQGEMAQDAVAHEQLMMQDVTPLQYLEQAIPEYTTLKWHAARRGLLHETLPSQRGVEVSEGSLS